MNGRPPARRIQGTLTLNSFKKATSPTEALTPVHAPVIEAQGHTPPPKPKRLPRPPPAALAWLKATSPAFRLRPVQPLAIGVHEELLTEPACPHTADEVRMAVRYYVQKTDYLRAVLNGGHRVNLDGSIAGEITSAERADAERRLAWRKAQQSVRDKRRSAE